METLLYIAGAVAIVFLLSQAASAVIGGGSDSLSDLGGLVDTSAASLTVRIARAIAVAEGGYDASGRNLNNGSRPSRNHNPMDMTADLIGKAVGKDGPFVQYANDADGWENGYAQVNAWLNGSSRYHSADSSIADLAGLGSETGFTSTDQQAWADTVARVLGVSTDTALSEIA